MLFRSKGYQIPQGSRQSKGLPLVNLLALNPEERLASMTCVKDFDDEQAALTFVTKNGIVKRTLVSEFKNIRQNGIIAVNLRDNDELINVSLTDGTKDIILGASNGKAIRFNETMVSTVGRTAIGVKGMSLSSNDAIVGVAIIDPNRENEDILVITENGFGKRTKTDQYRPQNRGGKGVKTLNVTEKNGALKTLTVVTDENDIIVVSDRGVVMRTDASKIAQTNRATQGVTIIKLKNDQKVSTVAIVPHQEDEEEETLNQDAFVQETLDVDTQETTPIVQELDADLEDTEENDETETNDQLFKD